MARDNELWKQIRADYLATGASYPELAEKHGVSLSTLKKRAMREKWSLDLDDVLLAEIEPEPAEMEPVPEMEPPEMEPKVELEPRDDLMMEAKRARLEKFLRITDAMMDRIEGALMSPEVTTPYAVKCLASALRDLREMQGLNRSALDIEEQKARIAKLKSETARYEVTEAEEAGGIIFLPMTEGKLVPPDE